MSLENQKLKWGDDWHVKVFGKEAVFVKLNSKTKLIKDVMFISGHVITTTAIKKPNFLTLISG